MRWEADPFSLSTTFERIDERMRPRPPNAPSRCHSTIWWRGGLTCEGRCDEGGEREPVFEVRHVRLLRLM